MKSSLRKSLKKTFARMTEPENCEIRSVALGSSIYRGWLARDGGRFLWVDEDCRRWSDRKARSRERRAVKSLTDRDGLVPRRITVMYTRPCPQLVPQSRREFRRWRRVGVWECSGRGLKGLSNETVRAYMKGEIRTLNQTREYELANRISA